MPKEKVLVIGLGQVGRPLYELIKESGKFEVYGHDIDVNKTRDVAQITSNESVDVMHICFPFINTEDFVESVIGYINRFNPQLIIINSTVPPGTTQKVYQSCCNTESSKLQRYIVHSPVRGVHKNLEHMKWEIKRWTKYIGGVNMESAIMAKKHFEEIGLKTKILRSSLETELAKLFETTYRAWMIVCFQEMHRISRYVGADFEEVVDFLEDTHRVRFDRPVMFPGVIGGHCLIPNTKMLLNVYDSEFLKLILNSNDKRAEEIKDVKVYEEVVKIKKRVERLQEEIEKMSSNF